MRLENVINEKLHRIEKRYYITMIGAILCGLIAHLYQFTNKIFNYDELGQTPGGYGAGVSLGRWGLQAIGDIMLKYYGACSLPLISGLITLLFVSLSACVIVYIFDIKDKVCCFLIGGIISTFPTLVATYFFMFTAPYYGLSMLLSCISSYLTIHALNSWSKKKSNGICSILCYSVGIIILAFAIGIYQSYCAVTLSILLIYAVMDFYADKKDFKDIFFEGIGFCISFVISLGVYLLVSKLAVCVTGIQLDDYRGASDMAAIDLKKLLYSIYRTYISYYGLMTKYDICQINCDRIIRLAFILLNIFVIAVIVRRIKHGGNLLNIIGFLLTILALPMAMFFPIILIHAQSDVSNCYTLMMYSVCFAFIFPIILYDKEEIKNISFKAFFIRDLWGIVVAGAITFSIIIYIWFANGNYQAMQYTNMHDLAYFETMATQIKSLDGYNADMTVAIVGNEFSDPTFQAGSLLGDRFDIDGKWETNVNYFNNIYLWSSYLGYTPNIIEMKDSGYLKNNPEVESMPTYPNDGSIKIVDGMVIVKASN